MTKKPVKRAVRKPNKWLRVWPFYNNRMMGQSPVEKAKATEKVSMALDDIIADLEADDVPKKSSKKKSR